MESMLNEELLGAAVVKVQFAADSVWERSLAVEKDARAPSSVDEWFGAFDAGHLGIEVFLGPCHENSCNVFAGVRVEANGANCALPGKVDKKKLQKTE